MPPSGTRLLSRLIDSVQETASGQPINPAPSPIKLSAQRPGNIHKVVNNFAAPAFTQPILDEEQQQSTEALRKQLLVVEHLLEGTSYTNLQNADRVERLKDKKDHVLLHQERDLRHSQDAIDGKNKEIVELQERLLKVETDLKEDIRLRTLRAEVADKEQEISLLTARLLKVESENERLEADGSVLTSISDTESLIAELKEARGLTHVAEAIRNGLVVNGLNSSPLYIP